MMGDCSERESLVKRPHASEDAVDVSVSQRGRRQQVRLVLFALAAGSLGFVAGVMWTTSYLIKPVRGACSPPWSPSSTVYGTSAMAAGWSLVAPFGICLRYDTLFGWLVTSIVMAAGSCGIAGLTVLFCHSMALVGELTYVGTFAFWSLGMTVGYIVCAEVGVRLLPNKPGIAGGIFPFATGVGSLVITQIIIALRDAFKECDINAGAMFICIGILIAAVTLPSVPILRCLQQETKTSVDDDSRPENLKWKNAWMVLKAPRTWFISLFMLCGYTPAFGILMYQEPLVVSLWNTAHPPVSMLAVILMTAYVIGRGLWLVISDKIGLKRSWLLGLIFQGLLLSVLAVLLTLDVTDSWAQYVSMTVLSVYMVVNPIFKITFYGLCYHLFSSRQRVSAVSVLCAISGIAGIAAPLIIDAAYNHFASQLPRNS
ncbi:uncharacterized protein LOC134178865 [Corticium candelabrum]|uniref:uncharacterized protein LOC134178865 n=1 Tax=Corticium candelabrum TaxID=121492 RepID=UPI002E273037|nr:uncharacterized protein LOC134178865 [Corticium candelabrum]